MDIVIDHDDQTGTLTVSIAGRMTHRLEMCPDDPGIMLGWGRDRAFSSLRIENALTLGSRGLDDTVCKHLVPRAILGRAIAFLAKLEEERSTPDSQAPTLRPPAGD